MVKLFLTALFSLSALAGTTDGFQGPLGDHWEKYQTINLISPLKLKSSLVIKTDKFIIGSNIITNGHKLDIEAREIQILNGAEIISFDVPQLSINSSPDAPENMGKTGTYPGGDGGTGTDGDPGFDGLMGLLNPAPITVKALTIDGILNVNGNGQTGGTGGKGATGGKGGKGGDGKNGWAKVSSTCGRSHDHGTDGGDGGAGGLGGKGGRGGDGGANVTLELLLQKNKFKYESKVGQAGTGGAPGDIGLSGDIGKGGKGDEDELDNALYSCTATANAGQDGTKKIRYESQMSLESRKGESGKYFSRSLNPLVINNVDELFSQKASVLEDAYAFHFSRLYLTLIQDSFRILVHEEITREQINNISESVAKILLAANQKLVDDMITNWSRHFRDKISNAEDFILYRKNAEQMILILKSMKDSDKSALTLKNEIQLLQQDASRLIRVKVRNLSSQCLKLNDLLIDVPMAQSFSLVHAPICKEEVIKSLLSNPKQSLIVNTTREKGVFTSEDFRNSLSVEEVDVNQSRSISQQQNVILLYNKTYTENDIRRAIPTASDKTQAASMISYNVPAETEVNTENIRAHIQSLGLGASLK